MEGRWGWGGAAGADWVGGALGGGIGVVRVRWQSCVVRRWGSLSPSSPWTTSSPSRLLSRLWDTRLPARRCTRHARLIMPRSFYTKRLRASFSSPSSSGSAAAPPPSSCTSVTRCSSGCSRPRGGPCRPLSRCFSTPPTRRLRMHLLSPAAQPAARRRAGGQLWRRAPTRPGQAGSWAGTRSWTLRRPGKEVVKTMVATTTCSGCPQPAATTAPPPILHMASPQPTAHQSTGREGRRPRPHLESGGHKTWVVDPRQRPLRQRRRIATLFPTCR